jgi:hypothetical protein
MNFLGTGDPLDLVHNKQRSINLTRKRRESKSPIFRELQPLVVETVFAVVPGNGRAQPVARLGRSLTQPGRIAQPKNLQSGFDLLMQVLREVFFWQPVDHLIEKTACDQTFGGEIIDTTALQIK